MLGPGLGEDEFGQPVHGETTTHKVWAARRDPAAGDDVKGDSSPGGLVVVSEASYIVRVGTDWQVGDRFTDEDGNRRQVDGIAKVGRSHLECLVKRVG